MNYIQVCLLLVMSLGMQVSYVSGQTNAHVRDLMELSPKELEAALQEVFMVTGEGGTWRRCPCDHLTTILSGLTQGQRMCYILWE